MTAYWLYGRLNLHVSASDEDVAEALRAYADKHVKGGREAIQPEHIAAVVAEHHDAQDLYNIATGSI